MIAETITQPEWIAPILQFGIGGGVLLWFMLRSEPRMKSMESAIDRMSKSMLLFILSMPHVSETAKQQANSLISEIDQADKDRSK